MEWSLPLSASVSLVVFDTPHAIDGIGARVFCADLALVRACDGEVSQRVTAPSVARTEWALLLTSAGGRRCFEFDHLLGRMHLLSID